MGRKPYHLEPHLYHKRVVMLQYVTIYKRQLLNAYISGDLTRINKAKISLSRYMKELAESPELGPEPRFKIPPKLEAIFKHGFDPSICWHELQSSRKNYYRVADIIERSVSYD